MGEVEQKFSVSGGTAITVCEVQDGSYWNSSNMIPPAAPSADFVYIFYYNDCTFESAAAAISLHRTLKGAYNAMRKHRADAHYEHMEMGRRYRTRFPETFAKAWFIQKEQIEA